MTGGKTWQAKFWKAVSYCSFLCHLVSEVCLYVKVGRDWKKGVNTVVTKNSENQRY